MPGTRIPTLDEVLSCRSGNNVQFNIETKSFPDHPELTPPPDVFARMLLDVIRKHKLESRSIVQSFDFRTLHAMKRLAPDIRLSALWEGDARPFADIAPKARPASSRRCSSWSRRSRSKPLTPPRSRWCPGPPTLRPTGRMLIDAGVDAIITDDPAALIAYLKEKGLR